MHVTYVKDDILITCLMFTDMFQEDHFNFILKFDVTAKLQIQIWSKPSTFVILFYVIYFLTKEQL